MPSGRVRYLSLKRSPGWLPRYGKCMSSSHALKVNKKDLNEKEIGNINKISYLLESLASSLASACQNHRRPAKSGEKDFWNGGRSGRRQGQSGQSGWRRAEGVDEVPGGSFSANGTCWKAFRDPRFTLLGRPGGSSVFWFSSCCARSSWDFFSTLWQRQMLALHVR